MHFLNWLGDSLFDRLAGEFAFTGAYGAPALFGALAFCAVFYIDRRRAKGRRMSFSGFVRTIFPKKLFTNPSVRLDMRLWLVNGVIFAATYGLFVVGDLFWRQLMLSALTQEFGAHAPTVLPLFVTMAIVTVVTVLAYEFGYWSIHYFFHVIPGLWEFHKLHHSAEMLTAMTELRMHPVETIVFMNSMALWSGLAFGGCEYAFGPGAQPFTLLNGNIVLLGFLITIGHLRHSNLWLAFGGNLGKIFQSPAHHQIHHSDQPKHFNKNLGFALSVWDWAFGTLYLPKAHEPINFGIGANHLDFATIRSGFVMPFVRAAEPLLAKLRRGATTTVEAPSPANAKAMQG